MAFEIKKSDSSQVIKPAIATTPVPAARPSGKMTHAEGKLQEATVKAKAETLQTSIKASAEIANGLIDIARIRELAMKDVAKIQAETEAHIAQSNARMAESEQKHRQCMERVDRVNEAIRLAKSHGLTEEETKAYLEAVKEALQK